MKKWLMSAYFLLMLFSGFRTLTGLLFLHPLTALMFGCLTVFWGWLFCNNLADLIEDERSIDP